jgi:hypothetical protein
MHLLLLMSLAVDPMVACLRQDVVALHALDGALDSALGDALGVADALLAHQVSYKLVESSAGASDVAASSYQVAWLHHAAWAYQASFQADSASSLAHLIKKIRFWHLNHRYRDLP